MIIDLGLIDYEESYRVQKEFVARRALGEIDDSLIIAEHPSVFTIGRAGRIERPALRVSEDILKEKDVKVLRVDRGGDITFHGPGQIVLYPILDLEDRGKDLHKYLRELEEAVMNFLKAFSVEGERISGKTGVWVAGKKIASIGIAASNWISYHGVSVNINMDLNFFSMINPCGLKDAQVTDLSAILGRNIRVIDVKDALIKHFKNAFNLFSFAKAMKTPLLLRRNYSDREYSCEAKSTVPLVLRSRIGYTPAWLKKRLVTSENIFEMKRVFCEGRVNTVCESSRCPNLNECYSRRFATFMILGKTCTRSCGFCSVDKAVPGTVDAEEPARVAGIVKRLKMKYVIITSVTRDDLDDGGSRQFSQTIRLIRNISDGMTIEALVPDFGGKIAPLETVLEARPNLLGHNIETVKRLYSLARKYADYERSLNLLKKAKEIDPSVLTKSGMMVGLGETEEEVVLGMNDLRMVGCDILTIGQYLRPGRGCLPVARFVRPDEFSRYKNIGEELGFLEVSSAPFVRSSYFAEEAYKKVEEKRDDKRCIAAAR